LFSYLSVYTQSVPVTTVGLNRAPDVLDKERVISPLQLEEGRNPLCGLYTHRLKRRRQEILHLRLCQDPFWKDHQN